MQDSLPQNPPEEAIVTVGGKSVDAKRLRRNQPAPPVSISFHDLDKRKTLLVMRLRMIAIANRMTSEQYTEMVKKALKSLYVTHARATGNLNKYGGHNGQPGYRNPNYLWDHLKLDEKGLPVAQESEISQESPLDKALENALESESALEDAQNNPQTEKVKDNDESGN